MPKTIHALYHQKDRLETCRSHFLRSGSTDYGLHRLLTSMGYGCSVAALH